MASLHNLIISVWMSSVGVDPVPVLRHLDVHPGDVGGAAYAPGDQPHHGPSARLGLTNKGRAAISDTGVLAHLTTSADLARMEHKPVTHSGLARVEGSLEFGLALIVGDEAQVDLLGDKLECAVNLILAPARHVAPDSGPVGKDVIKLVVAGWQTGGVDIRVGEVDVPVDGEEGDVVAEPGQGHGRVLEDPDHGVLLVTLLLRSVKAAGVPLTHSHLQQVIGGNVLQLVGSCEDLPGGGVVVVAEIVRDDGAGADKVVVLVEEDTGPGELPGGGLAVREAA